MNRAKSQMKKRRCKEHRMNWYLHALNKVIEGKAEPEFATRRWRKYKEIK